jgi:hypothetical protein
VNPEVVRRLRLAAQEGQSASGLLLLLTKLTTCERSAQYRSVAACHFEEAFGWTIHESKPLGAWSYFEGSSWDDEMIDSEFAPLLQAWRNLQRAISSTQMVDPAHTD